MSSKTLSTSLMNISATSKRSFMECSTKSLSFFLQDLQVKVSRVLMLSLHSQYLLNLLLLLPFWVRMTMKTTTEIFHRMSKIKKKPNQQITYTCKKKICKCNLFLYNAIKHVFFFSTFFFQRHLVFVIHSNKTHLPILIT